MGACDEIELKLDVEPGCAGALQALPELEGIAPQTRRLSAIYFDTAAQDLRGAGLSLRVRRSGGRRVQTIKADSSSATGLFARHEWEREVKSSRPELDDATDPIARFVATLGPLEPAFHTRIMRTTWNVPFGAARVELVLDEGRIVAGGRIEPVSEIELELIEGEQAALFAFAGTIAARMPARLGVLTKSERGYRLLDGAAERAIKAAPVVLTENMTAADAFRVIVRSCLRQYRLNETLLLATRAPQPLHQARVALRRLRSALSMFKPMIADDCFEDFRAGLRTLAGQLGEARNLDVLIERASGTPLADTLRQAREASYDAVCATLATAETRALILGVAEWITVGPWLAAEASAKLRERRAERFAHDLLDRYRRRLKRDGKRLTKIDDEARHEVRIDAKKLRYAAEFFAELYTSKPAPRRRRAFLAAIETLQSKLGEVNDEVTGVEVLQRLGISDPASLSLLDENTDRRRVLAAAAEAYETLIDVKRFWR